MSGDPRTLRLVGLAALVAVAYLLQRLRPFVGRPGSLRVNAVLFALGGAVTALVCGLCMVWASQLAREAGVGVFNIIEAPAAVSLAATVMGLDLVSYWWHRANHRIAFFWRFHKVHHSDTALTVSTAARFHPGELLLSFPMRMAGIVVLGAPAAAVVVFETVFNAFNYFEHADIGEGRTIEKLAGALFIVPSLHRRHHMACISLLNSNFGTVFSLWDRLFGTFGAGPPREGYKVGLPTGDKVPGVAAALLMPMENEPLASARNER